ncbi:hydroxypyruvate isomerase [Microbacterium sp. Root166]|nr:hydroxypyruvate isomerase [Microbacterium sp. Root166]
MYQLAANIELLFTEAGDYHDRVRAAADAGFTAVEMWGPTGADFPSVPKDIAALKTALEETNTQLTLQTAEPRTHFMLPPKDHSEFYRKLDEGVRIAQTLECPRLVVSGGTGFGGSRRRTQLDELVEIFRKATTQISGSGITLVLEAVNGRVDHPGMLLDRTADAVYVARGVDSPSFGVLYDLYHSVTEGENPEVELTNAGELIQYVQIADAPGRGEPGTGEIDWPAFFTVLRATGYDGPIGLEPVPQTSSAEAIQYIRELASRA